MFKQPKGEYPNHGTMTEYYVESITISQNYHLIYSHINQDQTRVPNLLSLQAFRIREKTKSSFHTSVRMAPN